MATAIATMVLRASRSPRKREKATVINGVSEPRKAAFGGGGGVDRVDERCDAMSSPRLATIIQSEPQAVTAIGRYGGQRRCPCAAGDSTSMTTMMPTERQMRYWNASTSSDRRFSTAPKLQMMPEPIAISEATTGRRRCSMTGRR